MELPPLKRCEYLINILSELGYAKAGSYGAEPLSFKEIKAYEDTTHTYLTSWEALMIKNLSAFYCIERNNKDKLAYPPYFGEFKPKSFKTILSRFKV